MSCIHYNKGKCSLSTTDVHEGCICPDFHEQPEKKYCKYCFNARIYKPTEEEMIDPFNTELTDENDSSSCGVGHSSSEFRMMVSSGHREPVRVEFDRWSIHMQQWITIGKYYPKYCPECGRRLNEYEVSKENN